MSVRTDLAMESIDFSKSQLPEGVTLETENTKNVKLDLLNINTKQGAIILKRPIGRYITATLPHFGSNIEIKEEEYDLLAKNLKKLLPQKGTVLVIGLGNIHITPDAIGPKSVDLILATRHMTEIALKPLEGFRSVAAMSTGVLGQTGIETAEIIKAVVDNIKPEAVIAIDALAASDVKRLGTTIQFADTGITPGAGVQNKRKELSKETLGVPVIAIGVPTVVDSNALIDSMGIEIENQNEPFMVTPRDIDLIINRACKIISMVINKALQEGFSCEDIRYLTC